MYSQLKDGGGENTEITDLLKKLVVAREESIIALKCLVQKSPAIVQEKPENKNGLFITTVIEKCIICKTKSSHFSIMKDVNSLKSYMVIDIRNFRFFKSHG